MLQSLFSSGFSLSTYTLELALFIFLLVRGHWKRLLDLFLFIVALLAVDIGRYYVLVRYGLRSDQYSNFYWLTDFVLAISAFLLVCSFFRRACAKEGRLWQFARLLLVFVFLVVLGISSLSLSQNIHHLIGNFFIEFWQNLWFTCLVLTTMLYLLMMQIESADEELGFLVCGLGIQFAGPAASFAFRYLTPGQSYSESLVRLIMPLCTLGTLATWLYAVARMPNVEATSGRGVNAPDAAEVAVSRA